MQVRYAAIAAEYPADTVKPLHIAASAQVPIRLPDAIGSVYITVAKFASVYVTVGLTQHRDISIVAAFPLAGSLNIRLRGGGGGGGGRDGGGGGRNNLGFDDRFEFPLSKLVYPEDSKKRDITIHGVGGYGSWMTRNVAIRGRGGYGGCKDGRSPEEIARQKATYLEAERVQLSKDELTRQHNVRRQHCEDNLRRLEGSHLREQTSRVNAERRKISQTLSAHSSTQRPPPPPPFPLRPEHQHSACNAELKAAAVERVWAEYTHELERCVNALARHFPSVNDAGEAGEEACTNFLTQNYKKRESGGHNAKGNRFAEFQDLLWELVLELGLQILTGRLVKWLQRLLERMARDYSSPEDCSENDEDIGAPGFPDNPNRKARRVDFGE